MSVHELDHLAIAFSGLLRVLAGFIGHAETVIARARTPPERSYAGKPSTFLGKSS